MDQPIGQPAANPDKTSRILAIVAAVVAIASAAVTVLLYLDQAAATRDQREANAATADRYKRRHAERVTWEAKADSKTAWIDQIRVINRSLLPVDGVSLSHITLPTREATGPWQANAGISLREAVPACHVATIIRPESLKIGKNTEMRFVDGNGRQWFRRPYETLSEKPLSEMTGNDWEYFQYVWADARHEKLSPDECSDSY
jgi:hypothetical protein